MADTSQSYANHRRTVPMFHFGIALCLLVLTVWSVRRLIEVQNFDTVANVVLVIALVLMTGFIRSFPLRVQDRLIRLEMRLRLKELLPAELQPRVGSFTPRQLIALRFASDHELPGLAATVLKDNIQDGTAIKKMIKEWQPDDLRV